MARGNEIGVAYYSLVPSMDGTAAAVNSQMGLVTGAGAAAGRKGGAALGAGLIGGLKIAGVVGAALGIAGIAGETRDYFEDSIKLASDLAESANAINVAFGDAAGGVADLGSTAAQRLALSNTAFNALAVRFSAFAQTIAGDGGDVVGVIDSITTRGADFASVFNIEVAEALTLFQSGLAGETEPLRRYGIDLSAAAVEAFALANGIGEQGRALTEAEKVQARYLLLLQQTDKVAGDFANTQDGYANSQRTVNALLENAQATIGEKFLPIAQDLSNWFLEEGVPLVERFADLIGDNQEAITLLGDLIQGGLSLALDDLSIKLAILTALTDDWHLSNSEMQDVFAALPEWAQDAFIAVGNTIFTFAFEYQNRMNGLANGVIGFLNSVMKAGMVAANFLRGLFGMPSVNAALIPYLPTAVGTPRGVTAEQFMGISSGAARRGSTGTFEFAEGAMVRARPGGVAATIGEGRYDETVLPMSPAVLGELGEAISERIGSVGSNGPVSLADRTITALADAIAQRTRVSMRAGVA